MSLESAKRFLEKEGQIASLVDGLPSKFFEPLILNGLRVDLIEPGRVVCSMKIPTRLLNSGNSLHGGATATLVDLVGSAAISTVGSSRTGVSVEINVSYLDAAYADEKKQRTSRSVCPFPKSNISMLSMPWESISWDYWKFQEDIEIEAKTLRVGKAVGVVTVEFRKKKTGKIFAQGRHTKYLAVASKL